MFKKEKKNSTRVMLDKVADDKVSIVDVEKYEHNKDNPLFRVPTGAGDYLIEKSTGKVWFTRRAIESEKVGLRVIDPIPMVRSDEVVMKVRMKNSMAGSFVQSAINSMDEEYVDGVQEDSKISE
jgi:hypothetical protein